MKTESPDTVLAETEQLPVDLMALLEQSDAPQTQSESVGETHRKNIELGRKMARYAVGPMPIEEFIDLIPECPERPDNMMPNSRRAFSRVPERGDIGFKDERSLYDPVNQAFNATRRNSESTEMARCPGVTFYNTSDQRRPGECSTKVGASGYAQEHLQFVQDPESLAIVSHPGYWQLFWEAKRIDFVGDNGILFEHITDERTKKHAIADFGLTSSYAAQMCANQYRDFAFSISLTDETARLLRWDRSGVIFSEDIHYRENSKPMCRFLWHFGNANSSQRGADTSVHKRTTQAEESLFRDTVKAHVKLQLGLTDEKEVVKAVEKHYEPGQVCIVEVSIHRESEDQPQASSSEYGTREQTQDQAATRKFLVSRPVDSPRSLASRSTRGYWAVDIQTKNIVFLKDCWRTVTDAEAVDIEGSTLQTLRARGVEVGVPTVVCHGDVYIGDAISSTLTPEYSENEWNMASEPYNITGRIHYRMVTAEVGYALQETFAGTRELLKGCQEVIHVLFNASTKANLIHRDISSTNIILVADETNSFGNRAAYVIDWEFAVSLNEEGCHWDRWRTGTPTFMCMNALSSINSSDPPTPYRRFFGHDVESLIYVALYCGLYRLPWNTYSEDQHKFFLRTMFDFAKGRMAKVTLTMESEVSNWLSVFPESEFRKWLMAALRLIPMWYPIPASLPSPEAILAEFSATVEVDPATQDELDAVPREMPTTTIQGFPTTSSTARSSSPNSTDFPDGYYRLRERVVELSSPALSALKRRRRRGQVVGSTTGTVGVRTRGRKRPSNETDGKEGQREVKHRKKRRK
ncbi:hypothetical protein EDD18DRAFT_1287774 [Armillaria luteobubalina]|uniref:Fungal-type protein kinase domain-containing protein n=1 Tax=Armillaria luteobubalina TaxID=153913 RepID=A0AA39Q387_9AGAR|nr:hypothetical protein EDD18DRAFT_1287774 [Armillaria luteobubalina]